MEHSTCTLDISSDEESAARMKDERGKENVPPLDDISQVRTVADEIRLAEVEIVGYKASVRSVRRRRDIGAGACDVDRSPLGEMPAEDFYAEGCDGESVFLIPAASEPAPAETEEPEEVEEHLPMTFDFIAEVKGKGKELDIDSLMHRDNFVVASKAAILEPIEKAEDGFQVWVS